MIQYLDMILFPTQYQYLVSYCEFLLQMFSLKCSGEKDIIKTVRMFWVYGHICVKDIKETSPPRTEMTLLNNLAFVVMYFYQSFY